MQSIIFKYLREMKKLEKWAFKFQITQKLFEDNAMVYSWRIASISKRRFDYFCKKWWINAAQFCTQGLVEFLFEKFDPRLCGTSCVSGSPRM